MKLFLIVCTVVLSLIAVPAHAQPVVGPVQSSALPDCPTGMMQYSQTNGQFSCAPHGKIIDLRDITNVPCDGVTDMTTAIQTGVNNASGNAMFYLPKYAGGACIAMNTISVPSNSRVWIDGTLMLGPNVNKSLLGIAANATNVNVGGYGILDGNKTNNTGGGLSGCFMTLGSATSNIWLHDLTIQNCKNWPVNFVGTSGAWMDNLILKDSGNSPEFAAGTNHCHARGLNISGIGDESFAFYGGVYLCSIEDSVIENLTGTGNVDGIAVLNDTSQPAPLHDIIIRGNIIHGMGQSGIAVNQGTGGGGDSYNILIANNELYQNGQRNTSGYCGIKLIGADNITVTGNYLHEDGNTTTPFACYGIDAVGDAHDVFIIGNLILNEGQGGTLGVGVNVASTCVNCIVSNNEIGDNQTTPTLAFGINGTAGPGNKFIMNTIYGTIGANPYNINFASDTTVEVPKAIAFRGVTTPGDGAAMTAYNINNIISLQNIAIGSFTVNAPAFPYNHQQITIMCDAPIITLIFAPGAGQTVTGGTTSCAPAQSHAWILTTNSTWKQIF